MTHLSDRMVVFEDIVTCQADCSSHWTTGIIIQPPAILRKAASEQQIRQVASQPMRLERLLEILLAPRRCLPARRRATAFRAASGRFFDFSFSLFDLPPALLFLRAAEAPNSRPCRPSCTLRRRSCLFWRTLWRPVSDSGLTRCSARDACAPCGTGKLCRTKQCTVAEMENVELNNIHSVTPSRCGNVERH